MKSRLYITLCTLTLTMFVGCSSAPASHDRTIGCMVSETPDAKPAASIDAARMLVWKAHITVQVWNISNAVQQATAMTKKQGGFVEASVERENQSTRMTLRIPAKVFVSSLGHFEALGTVVYRNVGSTDFTENYIDTDARLKNQIALRDKMKNLLAKATTIADTLAIEKELSRVQANIDSMESNLKSLRGQIAYATLELELKQKPLLGPLGYLFQGVWWGVEKLFIIRK